MPSLILLYTLIDSIAWAASDKMENRSREQFEDWLNVWVYPHNKLPCTPTELYAARCSILHTLTSIAKLHKKPGIRQIAYAWGPAKIADLTESIQAIGTDALVGVHLNELLSAIKDGMVRTFDAADQNPALYKRLSDASGLHYDQLPRNSLDRLIYNHRKKLNSPDIELESQQDRKPEPT